MIRPFTCLAVLLAAGSGLYLYSEKHRTTLLDQRIDAVVSDAQMVRAQTSMLQAEWALLNQPDRLQALAGRFLPQLQPIAPTQFVQLADLATRLPAEGPPPGAIPSAPATIAPLAPVLLSAVTIAPRLAPAKSPDAGSRAAPVRIAALSVAPGAPSSTRRRAPAPHRELTFAPAAVQPARWRPVAGYGRPTPVLASAWSRPGPAATPAPSVAPAFSGSALGIGGGIAPPMAAPMR